MHPKMLKSHFPPGYLLLLPAVHACYIFHHICVCMKTKSLYHTHPYAISTEIKLPKTHYKNRASALEVKFGVTGEGLSCYDPSYLIEQRAAFLHSINWNSAVNIEKKQCSSKQCSSKQCSIQKSSPSVLSEAEVPRPVSPLSAVPGRRPKRLWNFSDTAGVCHSMSVNRANV